MNLERIYIKEKFNVVIIERVSLVGALLLLLECLFSLFSKRLTKRV